MIAEKYQEPTVIFREEPSLPSHELTLATLKTGESVILDKNKNELRFISADHSVKLIISITDQGFVINLDAFQLNLRALDQLNLLGRKINISAEEEISLSTPGNILQEAGKNLTSAVGEIHESTAAIQRITADTGNVEITANDFVRMDAELIKLNCVPEQE